VRPPLAALLAVLAVALAAGCDAGTGGIEASGGSTENGRALFQDKCASCHVLAHAEEPGKPQGNTGPNLDDAFAGPREQGFAESTIREIVADQIKYAVPPMPQNLVKGDDVADVAAYVASVAGADGFSEQPAGGPSATGGTDGKSIFASAGCGSCHTFAAAGTNGTIGPNLDDSKPTFELAIERITNGKGQMPPFRDRLSDDQIRSVAEFVSGRGS
jgi:cbb3-type cytochrome c oxidase subunit III